MKNYYACYFDGACEPVNPGGNMGIGAFILSPERQRIFTHSDYIPASKLNGKTSNNVAEYMGVIAILEFLLQDGFQNNKIKVAGDSKLVINQLSGEWQARKGVYIPYYIEAREMVSEFTDITFHWVAREKNHRADDLSKGIMLENNCEFRIQKP